MLPLDGYVRVSQAPTRSVQQRISPAVQEEVIRAYIQAHGRETGIVYHELGRSGQSTRDRPCLAEALGRIETGCSGGLVVARIDRFARSVIDALEAIRRIDVAGGRFVSVGDGLDSGTAWGRAMLSILLALAELELSRIREGWQTAQARAVNRGIHISPTTPTGYLRRADQILIPDPAEAPAVQEAFRLRSRGEGYVAITAVLRDLGVGRAAQHGSLTPHGVEGLLSNPVYLGEARCGELRRPLAHTPLVSPLRWLAAQSRESLPANARAEALLAGLICCSGCGHRLKAYKRRGTREGNGDSVVVAYQCRSHHRTSDCPAPVYARAATVEPLVIAGCLSWLRWISRPNGLHARILVAENAWFAAVTEYQRLTERSDRTRTAIVAQAESAVVTATRQLVRFVPLAAATALPNPLELHAQWRHLPLRTQQHVLRAAVASLEAARSINRADGAEIILVHPHPRRVNDPRNPADVERVLRQFAATPRRATDNSPP